MTHLTSLADAGPSSLPLDGGEDVIASRRSPRRPGLALTGCFDKPCEERNPAQMAFLDGLKALAKPALASNNPLQIEEAAKQSIALAEKVGAFSDWCGTLTKIEGTPRRSPSRSISAAKFRSTRSTTGPWPSPARFSTFSPHDRANRRRRAFPIPPSRR